MISHPLKFFERYEITPRPQQEKIINQVHAEWNNYKYFILSCPTGTGKTYIATAIAASLNKSYLLTSTLQLQDQYIKSWPELINLKGRSNYTCNVNNNFTVDAAPCIVNESLYKLCIATNKCSYHTQKKRAIISQAMITNPQFMLYSSQQAFDDTKNDSPWVQRDVIIFDECHNIEKHLVSFAELDIDPVDYHKTMGVDTSKIEFTTDDASNYEAIKVVHDAFKERLKILIKQLENEFPQRNLINVNLQEWARGFKGKAAERVNRLNKKITQLHNVIHTLTVFFNSHQTPEELTARWIIHKYPEKNVIKLAPIYGNFLFHEYFDKLGKKFMFLSATPGSKEQFCRELGLPLAKTLFIEIDSPFDPALSPVMVIPIIKLSKDHYEENVKKVGKIINDILDIHGEGKGIIHSVTYDLMKHIYLGVTPAHRERLLCRDMTVLKPSLSQHYPKKYTNNELLALHESKDTKASVLLSPSMMEGIDLHDELSEFQIIIKLPWANLGDARTRIKTQLDNDWYNNQMWLSILQASGRSTRHEKDTAVTYILDKNFNFFFNKWKHNLPDWFKRRLVF